MPAPCPLPPAPCPLPPVLRCAARLPPAPCYPTALRLPAPYRAALPRLPRLPSLPSLPSAQPAQPAQCPACPLCCAVLRVCPCPLATLLRSAQRSAQRSTGAQRTALGAWWMQTECLGWSRSVPRAVGNRGLGAGAGRGGWLEPEWDSGCRGGGILSSPPRGNKWGARALSPDHRQIIMIFQGGSH